MIEEGGFGPGYKIEHLFVNEVHAHGAPFAVHYWRDKAQHEVDFVLRRGGDPIAVECKGSERSFDARGLAAFRRRYPAGDNWLVVPEGGETWGTIVRGLRVEVVPLSEVERKLLDASICAWKWSTLRRSRGGWSIPRAQTSWGFRSPPEPRTDATWVTRRSQPMGASGSSAFNRSGTTFS